MNDPAQQPSASTYRELIAFNAAHYAQRPAIVFEDKVSTWTELEQASATWAKALLAAGVGRGDMVAVHCANRPQWLLLAVACARIGAVLTPLNTFYTDDEIAYQLTHSRASVLFAVGSIRRHEYSALWRRLLPQVSRGHVVRSPFDRLRLLVELEGSPHPDALGFDAWLAAGEATTDACLEAAEDAVRPDDDMYVLYTSGSTARPKGVRLAQGNGLANAFQIGERQGLTSNDMTWIGTPLFYGLAAINAIPAIWTHGGAALLQEVFEPGEALELIERHRATAYVGLSNITRALYEHPDRSRRDISSLKKGLTGFSEKDMRLAIEGLGIEHCCSLYGMTEAYGNCFVSRWSEPVVIRSTTQGFPLPNWEFRLMSVDDQTLSATPGDAGVLEIRGYLSPGYLDNDQENKAAFTADGFFRTGDIVSFDVNGRLRFQGRIKDVIKVSGVNVSPLEVESLISRHPFVRECHVAAVPDDVRGEVIAAFVDLGGSGPMTADDIRSFVSERAARFKVPTYVLFGPAGALPRVASGKVPRYLLAREAMARLGIDADI